MRDLLREAGFLKTTRGQQYAGGGDSPDVRCPELPWLHIEVKFVEKFSLWDAFRQAIRDACDKTPTVWWKKKGQPCLVILQAADFLEIIRNSDLVFSESEKEEIK